MVGDNRLVLLDLQLIDEVHWVQLISRGLNLQNLWEFTQSFFLPDQIKKDISKYVTCKSYMCTLPHMKKDILSISRIGFLYLPLFHILKCHLLCKTIYNIMKLQTSHYELGQELKFWTQQSATGCAPLKSLQNLKLWNLNILILQIRYTNQTKASAPIVFPHNLATPRSPTRCLTMALMCHCSPVLTGRSSIKIAWQIMYDSFSSKAP